MQSGIFSKGRNGTGGTVQGETLKGIRGNKDLQMTVNMTDVFPIFLGSLALRQIFLFFLSLWTMLDLSPQLLVSQYTCASIRKRANTQACTHRLTVNFYLTFPEDLFRLTDFVLEPQTKIKGYIAAGLSVIRITL